jgi:hypothetical protein
MGLNVPTSWWLYFKEGGVGVFLPVFLRLMHEFRNSGAQAEGS